MRFECWIIKTTNTDSEYVILIAFSTGTVVALTGQSVGFIHTRPALFLVIWPMCRKGCSPPT